VAAATLLLPQIYATPETYNGVDHTAASSPRHQVSLTRRLPGLRPKARVRTSRSPSRLMPSAQLPADATYTYQMLQPRRKDKMCTASTVLLMAAFDDMPLTNERNAAVLSTNHKTCFPRSRLRRRHRVNSTAAASACAKGFPPALMASALYPHTASKLAPAWPVLACTVIAPIDAGRPGSACASDAMTTRVSRPRRGVVA